MLEQKEGSMQFDQSLVQKSLDHYLETLLQKQSMTNQQELKGLHDSNINLEKLMVVIADKIDPFLVSGEERDRRLSLREPI
jgi:hypothetical protein